MTTTLKHLARDLALSLDPIKFAASVGFPQLSEWQKELLLTTDRRCLVLCARQTGKTAVAGLAALFEAVNVPGSVILVVSPSLRQSSELFKRILAMYAHLEHVQSDRLSALQLQLKNGSRIIALPSKQETLRGYTANMVIIDEAARCPDSLYEAVRPFLATTNGKLLLLSTPFAKRGFLHLEWTEGVGWKRYTITADKCERISKEFLEAERRALGQYAYEAEYCCIFHDSQTALFRQDVIDRAIRDFDELDISLEENAGAVTNDDDDLFDFDF